MGSYVIPLIVAEVLVLFILVMGIIISFVWNLNSYIDRKLESARRDTVSE